MMSEWGCSVSSLNNIVICLLLSTGIVADSPAGDTNSAEQSRSVDLKDGDALDKAQAKNKQEAGKLRCWQGGRLVFEGRGAMPVDGTSSVADFHIRNGRSVVRVFDLREGLCVLEYVEGSNGAAK